MKKIVYLTLIFLLFFTKGLNAQTYNFKKETDVYWKPEGTQSGCDATIRIVIEYTVFGGPMHSCKAAVVKKGNNIYYNGKHYTAQQVGESASSELNISSVDVEADIYQGNQKITTVRFDGVIDFGSTGGRPSWNDLFPGLNEKEAKTLYKEGFDIKNIRVKNVSVKGISSLEKALGTSQTVESRNTNSENTSVNNDYKQKRSEYLEFIKKGDQAFRNGNWKDASKYYKSAITMDFDPDMNPNLPTRYSIIRKYARANQNINATSNTEKTKNTNSYSQNYNQTEKHKTQQQRTYSENNTNSGTYNNSNNYSSQNTSEDNSNDYWDQWAEDYKKEASNNKAEYQQSLNNLSNAVVGIAQEYQRANEEAKQRKLQQEREEERRREAEEERRAAERRRIYNAKVNAMNNMDAFEKDFQSYFNKDIDRANSNQAVYFYFGTVKKYFDSKSGNLYLSNIFPVYKVSANRWPFISDIINEIENNYGNVIMRGYFTSLHEAKRDRENMIAYAKNSYFQNIYEKQYQFQFNKSTSNHSETDYWGNKVSNKKNNTKKTDFWGNVVESENDETKEVDGTTNTKTEEQPKTDFWGNVIETGDTKKTDVNLNPPTVEKIKKIMQDFSFDNKARQVSISEAERILGYLGVKNFRKGQHQGAEPFLYGKLNENYAITIWVGTYGKKDRYGVRFGKSDYSYHGNNDSYFEIIIP